MAGFIRFGMLKAMEGGVAREIDHRGDDCGDHQDIARAGEIGGEKTGEACRETYIPSIAQNTDPKELFIHGTTVACNGFDPAKLTNYK